MYLIRKPIIMARAFLHSQVEIRNYRQELNNFEFLSKI